MLSSVADGLQTVNWADNVCMSVKENIHHKQYMNKIYINNVSLKNHA